MATPRKSRKSPESRKKTPRRRRGATRGARQHAGRARPGRWSQRVTRTSDALDLDEGVFRLRSPAAIARSLRRSAERSHRRKSSPYRSAMSMLTFYLNRAGTTLSPTRRRTLEKAKDALRASFHR